MLLRARLRQRPAAAPEQDISAPLAPANDAELRRLPQWLPAIAAPPPSPSVNGIYRPGYLSTARLSFGLVVLLPIAIASLYYFAVAADQYIAEFRFSLRAAEAPRPMLSWPFDASAASPPTQAESQIVVQYIGSRAIIDELDSELPLRPLFASAAADWWSRLSLPTSIETLLEYWRHQVDAFYEPSTGTVIVRVRAFTPQASLQLAEAIVGAAERLVNQLSERARHDLLHHAQEDVAQAELRLKTALASIRDFRDREGLIDPGKTADATAGMAARLRDELVRTQADLSTLQTYMRDDSPVIKVLKARIHSLEAERHGAVRELTDRGSVVGNAPPRTLGAYEQLDSERKYAELAYQHALETLDRARADADRQQLYVASFVPPRLPEEARYPRRWRSLATVALVAFAVWGIGGLTLRSIREHI
jgi:capsular polysaccharide transport system permease protein